jgi:hypothetical protein
MSGSCWARWAWLCIPSRFSRTPEAIINRLRFVPLKLRAFHHKRVRASALRECYALFQWVSTATDENSFSAASRDLAGPDPWVNRARRGGTGTSLPASRFRVALAQLAQRRFTLLIGVCVLG